MTRHEPVGRNPRKRSEAGLTTIELMIAITMFGILMVGFLGVFPLGLRTVQKGERMTVASGLVQDEIERLKTLRGTDADLAAGNHVDAGNPLRGVYTRNWAITDNTPLAGMKRIDVTVSFSDNGIPRTIRMSTYITP
jgi:type II secretory pathway pseudopilin PulG